MTPSSEHRALPSALEALRLRLRRERALIAWFELGQKKSFGLRAAKLYAFGVFIAYAIAISVATDSARGQAIQGFLQAALGALSWVVGALAALGTARGLAQQTERDAERALAVQRGFDRRAVWRARTLAGALRIARLIGVPALLLVGVALARGQSLAWALVLVPALAVYAAAFGLCVAILAQFSADLSARHPRALLAALVLGPLLVAQVYPSVPSLPGVFSALLDRLLAAGAAFT
ncbi:MAG TPA: hypothetical protein VNW92_20770 [Polyangiaceae bacterium]|nr:hypothetical protein [Polyangiaceae bacterium]